MIDSDPKAETTQSLTAEQIAVMLADIDGAEERCPPGYVATCTTQIRAARALLAMASRLIERDGAAKKLAERWFARAGDIRSDGAGPQFTRVAECLEDCAEELLSWTPPSQSKGGG